MAAVTENNETTTTPSPVKAVPVKEVPTEAGDVATNGAAEEKVVENGKSEEKVVENGKSEEKVVENGHTNGTNGVDKEESPAKEAEKRSIDETVEAESEESSPKKKKVEEATETTEEAATAEA